MIVACWVLGQRFIWESFHPHVPVLRRPIVLRFLRFLMKSRARLPVSTILVWIGEIGSLGKLSSVLKLYFHFLNMAWLFLNLHTALGFYFEKSFFRVSFSSCVTTVDFFQNVAVFQEVSLQYQSVRKRKDKKSCKLLHIQKLTLLPLILSSLKILFTKPLLFLICFFSRLLHKIPSFHFNTLL